MAKTPDNKKGKNKTKVQKGKNVTTFLVYFNHKKFNRNKLLWNHACYKLGKFLCRPLSDCLPTLVSVPFANKGHILLLADKGQMLLSYVVAFCNDL